MHLKRIPHQLDGNKAIPIAQSQVLFDPSKGGGSFDHTPNRSKQILRDQTRPYLVSQPDKNFMSEVMSQQTQKQQIGRLEGSAAKKAQEGVEDGVAS